jgi:hypothetical protein
MFNALEIFKYATGRAYLKLKQPSKKTDVEACKKAGEKILEAKDPIINKLEIVADGFENSNRKVKLIKVAECYHIFKELIEYFAALNIVAYISKDEIKNFKQFVKRLPSNPKRETWLNIGGQLIRETEFEKFGKQFTTVK